jgi:hypothetical protein
MQTLSTPVRARSVLASLATATLIATAFVPVALGAAPLKDGAYAGGGEWRSAAGQSGSYSVTATVTGDTIASVYRYGDREERWSIALVPTGGGFVDVTSEGSKVGSGYCYDVQCHYTAFDGQLEETLTFYEGSLYKLGSKVVDGQRIMWQEALRLASKES